ncbi:hypothetical protein AV530_006532 [Patagioenas fasciata monilis]|uniref:Uncharacterized protein n=1 Tax=Patagioenas fasciata monilis TaxID=372326 RepID=A0A1V4KGR4_PATFA|nr:hypothetical protein AV530_006532 [Patagioenas fasciata monilis]
MASEPKYSVFMSSLHVAPSHTLFQASLSYLVKCWTQHLQERSMAGKNNNAESCCVALYPAKTKRPFENNGFCVAAEPGVARSRFHINCLPVMPLHVLYLS